MSEVTLKPAGIEKLVPIITYHQQRKNYLGEYCHHNVKQDSPNGSRERKDVPQRNGSE